MRKKRRRKTSGKFLPFLALFSLLIAPLPADDYALIFGSIFAPTGRALADADVMLQPESGKPQKTKSSPRGEFTFRVPAKPVRYTVIVKARGYRTETKSVSIQADERADVTFLLEAEK